MTKSGVFFSCLVGIGVVGGLYYLYGQEYTKSLPTNVGKESPTRGLNITSSSTPRKGPRKSLKPSNDIIVEICLSDLQSLREACAGGCTSIELCSNRREGGKAINIVKEHNQLSISSCNVSLGVTPSIGLIEQAVSVVGGRNIALHVLIRPRPGGFVYSDDEFDIIQRDITAAKLAGVDGKHCLVCLES